ncbi:hypothetical protein [Curtobacterium sp. ISL-83]|uniref:hypothetical protein n=1 Tax=Curtobacterium sp. ISL-83 TaxID=2819145 RepID=UPI001BEB1466|nr:hypothetical protein [Curtobacterium sp. ISL-83]MBT2503564.1 hypothetical protein [Curtobacterium sp. ISL-83]
MNDSDISPRLAAMRDALVADVDAVRSGGTRPPRRLWASRGTVAAVVGAFLVGSAVTGGITAAALPGADPDAALESSLATSTRYQVEEGNHGRLLGTPRFTVASGHATLDLGAPPAGADRVTLTWECLDRGTVTVELGGSAIDGPTSCAPSSRTGRATSVGSQWGMYPAPASGQAAVSVSGSGATRYAVWASWAKAATIARPSVQQHAATADHVVTRDEYTAAFNRLEGCLAQAGHPIGTVPLSWFSNGVWTQRPPGSGPWYVYSTSSAATEVFDTQCYPREFEDVDDVWQSEHPMPTDSPAQSSTGG